MIISSLGWTLIHSIWQGLLIFIALKAAVRFTNRSDIRYAMAVGALTLMVLTSGVTFLLLNDTGSAEHSPFLLVSNSIIAAQPEQSASFFTVCFNWLDTNIIWIIRFWMLGFAAGMIRIAAGLFYINRLKRNSHPVDEEWQHMVNDLSQSLNIKRLVSIAEAGITSPMVVGFMKPVILFPIGLLAGLTAEQVETILVHELSHVRRQDYIINLIQAIVETIFFFNPFALLISSAIRDERENCCDDMVIAKGISPISYVKTLAHLEASRCANGSSSALALGISGNKNQLLNRIKRIMEKSAKNDWGKGRLVPVAVVFLGLICASWLSIGSEAEVKENNLSYIHTINTHTPAKSDTSREDGLKVLKSNKHKRDEPFDPVPPLDNGYEEFEMPPMPEIPDMDIDMHMEMAMKALESMPEIEIPMMDFDGFDSIPGFAFRKRMDTRAFEQFEEEFTTRFREEFKEFYEQNREQFEKMMREMEKERRDAAEVVDLQQMQNGRWSYAVPKISGHDWAPAIGFRFNDEPLKIMNEQLARQGAVIASMSRNFEDYKAELVDMLIEDGYVGKGESIENLNINDNGDELTINGHKIKEKDIVKYKALHDKYLKQTYKIEQPRYTPNRQE